MLRWLAGIVGARAIGEKIACDADEIGAGFFDQHQPLSLCHGKAAKTLLDEIAKILLRRAAPQITCERRLMRVVDRFHAGHRTRVNRPVFGRHRNLRFQPAPRRMFVVEIHSIVAFRSDRKTGCRVVRTYSEKICAAAFSPRAWTYASATRTTDGISQRLRARFLRLGTARLLARCGSSIAWRCAGARS